jgi:hypothetical protein
MRNKWQIFISILYLWCAGLALLLIPALFDADSFMPLRTPLAFPHGKPFRATFTPRHDRPHQVCLEFTRPDSPLAKETRSQYWLDEDKRTDRTLDPAWRVQHRNGKLVAAGSWHGNALRRQAGNALAFGEFEATAGRELKVEISPGPHADALLATAPVLVIHTVGPAWAEGLTMLVPFCQGLGFVLLAAGALIVVLTLRIRSRRPRSQALPAPGRGA